MAPARKVVKENGPARAKISRPFSVGGYVEALGVLCLAAAVWNFGSMLWLVFANGDPRGVAMGLWAAWCLGAGVSLIAAAEVLRRLLDMAESLRRMREK